ncbi:MAG: hypothetical protein ACUZ8O_03725 [Candidatus Anammoxibacter sp.]
MALCETWNNGSFQGTLKDLHVNICKIIKSKQHPQYNEYGPVASGFKNQRAFAVHSRPFFRCVLDIYGKNEKHAK